jgi:cysteinyl-tRNA synthetase
MSKSLGNFFTVREVLQRYRPEIIRFFILSSHYRSPLNYSDESLNDAKAKLDRLYTVLRGVELKEEIASLGDDTHFKKGESKALFTRAMDDDFNTPKAIAVLFELAKEINKAKEDNPERAGYLANHLKKLGGLLGILQDEPDAFLKGRTIQISDTAYGIDTVKVTKYNSEDEYIDQQIQARLDAKKAKNWALADQIRDELKQRGVILEDAPDATTSWRRE